ncbi:hypothetical protein ACFW9N_42985 [Streptomyces sp. NPDC059496]|uniref:hypothetical protein n=1 Tax=Streptomyces sp. NPDC059496 TaxID=3346851 RepID=UPI0036B0A0E4
MSGYPRWFRARVRSRFAVVRFEIVRDAMNTALAAILTGFGYRIPRDHDGPGHIVSR